MNKGESYKDEPIVNIENLQLDDIPVAKENGDFRIRFHQTLPEHGGNLFKHQRPSLCKTHEKPKKRESKDFRMKK